MSYSSCKKNIENSEVEFIKIQGFCVCKRIEKYFLSLKSAKIYKKIIIVLRILKILFNTKKHMQVYNVHLCNQYMYKFLNT